MSRAPTNTDAWNGDAARLHFFAQQNSDGRLTGAEANRLPRQAAAAPKKHTRDQVVSMAQAAGCGCKACRERAAQVVDTLAEEGVLTFAQGPAPDTRSKAVTVLMCTMTEVVSVVRGDRTGFNGFPTRDGAGCLIDALEGAGLRLVEATENKPNGLKPAALEVIAGVSRGTPGDYISLPIGNSGAERILGALIAAGYKIVEA